MTTYRVSIRSMSASYVERWEAESPREAEERARARWQREFGDAGAFRFYAKPDRPERRGEEDDEV